MPVSSLCSHTCQELTPSRQGNQLTIVRLIETSWGCWTSHMRLRRLLIRRTRIKGCAWRLLTNKNFKNYLGNNWLTAKNKIIKNWSTSYFNKFNSKKVRPCFKNMNMRDSGRRHMCKLRRYWWMPKKTCPSSSSPRSHSYWREYPTLSRYPRSMRLKAKLTRI